MRTPDRVIPPLLDAVIAGAFFVIGVIEVVAEPLAEDVVEGPMWLNLLAVAGCTLPLAWRRRAPFWVSITVFAAWAARALVEQPLEVYPVPIAALVATYTVASYAPLRDALLAAGFSALAISVAVVNGTGTDSAPDPLASAVLYGTVWLVGRVVGMRNERAQALLEARDEHAAEAVAEERARIAREMHDAVSHSLAAIVMQSSGAQNVIDSDPERARASLASIESTGRRGLEEMRRMLGLLGDTGADLGPQPGLARLDELVAAVEEAGLGVDVKVEGQQRRLPDTVDTSAYRIVQESLTNVMKHASARTAAVRLRYDAECLVVLVADDGDGESQADASAGGRGLTGMRERVQLLGGDFRAGATGSGFEVEARLPL